MTNETTLAKLLQSLDVILSRITPSHLRRYDSLQRSLHSCDVSADPDYRRLFNGFYRMGRKSESWYVFFFSMLEREKKNAALTFPDVLQRIYVETGRVEPSFSSKLVATVRPAQPVYDKHVRTNLSLAVPRPHESPQSRVEKFVAAYADLQSKVECLVGRDEFSDLRRSFDQAFPEYVHFTDIKKLDLLLWQNRR